MIYNEFKIILVTVTHILCLIFLKNFVNSSIQHVSVIISKIIYKHLNKKAKKKVKLRRSHEYEIQIFSNLVSLSYQELEFSSRKYDHHSYRRKNMFSREKSGLFNVKILPLLASQKP